MRWLAAALTVAGLLQGGGVFAQDFRAVLEQERAELAAERDALKESLQRAQDSAAAAERALEADIEHLTEALAEARAQNEARTQSLQQSEHVHALEDDARRMTHIQEQMDAWLATRRVRTSTDTSIPARVAAALDHLEGQGGLSTRQSDYFGADGRARSGRVRYFGQVAAVLLDPARTPLVQVADGSLRAVSGLDTGSTPFPGGEVVSAVLFDPKEAHTPTVHATESWLEWMHRGGPIMWPLAVMGAFALLLALERALALTRGWIRAGHAPARREDPLLAAVALAGEAGPAEEVEARAAEALARAQPRLRRGISFLGITAASAPLIGLLGTVTGMISTFAVITEHGTGDPRLLSSGISEALLTTQLGLMVAVPALLMQTALLRAAGAVSARIEARALEALESRDG
jgi:biopolymer transport protein ExbB